MEIKIFRKLLEDHNWNYISSNDEKIRELGRSTHNNLLKLASLNGEFKKRIYFI